MSTCEHPRAGASNPAFTCFHRRSRASTKEYPTPNSIPRPVSKKSLRNQLSQLLVRRCPQAADESPFRQIVNHLSKRALRTQQDSHQASAIPPYWIDGFHLIERDAHFAPVTRDHQFPAGIADPLQTQAEPHHEGRPKEEQANQKPGITGDGDVAGSYEHVEENPGDQSHPDHWKQQLVEERDEFAGEPDRPLGGDTGRHKGRLDSHDSSLGALSGGGNQGNHLSGSRDFA